MACDMRGIASIPMTACFGARLAILLAPLAAMAVPAFAAPQKWQAKAREIYSATIAIPTVAGRGEVPRMAAYLAEQFRAAGFPTEDIHILPHGETAAFVVRYRGDGTSGRKAILLLAHMDVVTAKRQDWQRDPFQRVEENGFFYGRGTYDVKHGVTELTTLFLRLKAETYVPKRDLIIYFSGDEETAMATTVAVACPFCNIMLTDGMKQRNVEEKIAVLDVAELVARSIPDVPVSALVRRKPAS